MKFSSGIVLFLSTLAAVHGTHHHSPTDAPAAPTAPTDAPSDSPTVTPTVSAAPTGSPSEAPTEIPICRTLNQGFGSSGTCPDDYTVETLRCNSGSPYMDVPETGNCSGGSVAELSCNLKTCDWDTANTDANSGADCLRLQSSNRETGQCTGATVTAYQSCPVGYVVEDYECSTSNSKMNKDESTISMSWLGGQQYQPAQAKCKYINNDAGPFSPCNTATTTTKVLCKKMECEDGTRFLESNIPGGNRLLRGTA